MGFTDKNIKWMEKRMVPASTIETITVLAFLRNVMAFMTRSPPQACPEDILARI
jgi:hypothetical protein